MEFENPLFDDREGLIEGDDDEGLIDDEDNLPKGQGAVEVPNSSLSWARSDIPAAISSDNLATLKQTEILKD